MLVLIGCIMVYSSSSAIADSAANPDGSAKYSGHAFFLKRQVIWLIMAYTAMLIAARVNIDYIRRSIPLALMLSMALLMIVFLMPPVRDTHRWMSFGFVSLQPSEIFKYVLVFYLAHSLSQKGRTLDDPRQYLWPYGPVILGGALLIVLEPDLGTVLVTLGTVFTILFLAGARLKHMAIALGGSAAAVSFLVFILGYKKARMDSYLSSLSDPLQTSHQVKQSLLSMASGGVFGAGLGNGIFKQFYLPEPHTDFIFASIGEELGLIGLSFTLLLLFGLIWRGLRIAIGQTDRFRFLLAAGLTMCLGVNICINVAVVMGLIPTTGITLPFLSYGGSSLAVSAAAVGILLNLSRQREVLAR